MLRISVGQDLDLQKLDVRTGNTNGRDWMMIIMKAEKGYDEISLFASNAEDAKNYATAKIKQIESVEKSVKVSTDRNGNKKYYDRFSATVVLEGEDMNKAVKNAGFERFATAMAGTAQKAQGDQFMDMNNVSDDFPFA